MVGGYISAFVGIFIAIQWGTLNLDPDEPEGSQWGNLLAGCTFVIGLIVVWKCLKGMKQKSDNP